MSNLNPKFHVASESDVSGLLSKILTLCDFVLTSFGKGGRQTRAIDQIVDRFWSGQANRVNKAREAKALASGQDGYTRVNAYDAMKGVYQGDDEYLCTEFDVVDLVNKICKAGNISTFVDSKQATEIFNALTERYANHPDAQTYITLESLEDEQIDSFDQTDDKNKGSKTPVKPAVPAGNGAQATV